MDNIKNNINKLAKTIVKHSVKVQPNESVLIRFKSVESIELVKAIIEQVFEVGGIPFTKLEDLELNNLLKANYSNDSIKEVLKRREFDVLNHDCFISIGYNKSFEKQTKLNTEFKVNYAKEVYNINSIFDKKKWVIVNYPSQEDAKKANMSYEEYFSFAMKCMNADYKKMHESMLPLKKLMDKTEKVTIIAPNTNLSFSIKGINSNILAGEINVPDGEIYTAPVKNSVNGHVTFNFKSPYKDEVFEDVKLVFENGKVVSCNAGEKTKLLNEILDIDEGARYIGEFAFGVNPNIKEPITDILFDEKVLGSFHIALGNCYSNANNGNKSAIHWDLIRMMTETYGGGEIYFDDVLIQKDGIFMLKELENLNENEEREVC